MLLDLDRFINLLEEAGAAILQFYTRPMSVIEKSDHSPLTSADLASNKILLAGLQQLTPGIPILSEEGEPIPFELRSTWQQYWVIDPLDGTRDFLAQTDEFCIGIALIQEGRAIVGAIHEPLSGITHFAQQGQGVLKKAPCGSLEYLKRPLACEQVRLLVSRQSPSQELHSFADQQQLPFLPCGSALKFIRLLEGRGELLLRLRPSAIWDIAPGVCLVEELGGQFLDLQQTPLSFMAEKNLLYPPFAAFLDPHYMASLWAPLETFLKCGLKS